MSKISLFVIILICFAGGIVAQVTVAQQGEPPIAALISISTPNDAGVVTISGGAGAVFPVAQIAIRNLFTGEVVYTTAGITGSFTAQIYGPNKTPFEISPAVSIPANLRGLDGALPGGPSTIIYGNAPRPRQSITTTQLLIDGYLDDWQAYPDARLDDDVFALMNVDSLYLGLIGFMPDANELLTASLILDDIVYELTFDPANPDVMMAQRVTATPINAVSSPIAAIVDVDNDRIELRFAWHIDVQEAILERIFVHTSEEADGDESQVIREWLPEGNNTILINDERDGFVYPDGVMQNSISNFYVAGPLKYAQTYWEATGRINTLNANPDESLVIELDTSLIVPQDVEIDDSLVGELWLQPVTIGADGAQNIPALHTNNGWSSLITDSGLAIDNVRGDVYLGAVTLPSQQIIRRTGSILAAFRFDVILPNQLPDGLYVPVFKGNFSATNAISRLPLVLNIGEVEESRLLWTMFYDHPSDGSRGILPDEDAGYAALSNRVRFNSPTYILPPGAYPLEPYLLNQLPNTYAMSAAPLLPLLFPGGRLSGQVILPDGSIDDLSDTPISQNRLSTGALDERDRFGGQSPVNAYRLTTANPIYNAYNFDQYGEYEIELIGHVEDATGHRYAGGGTYRVLVANQLDFSPGVLSGTPFHIGDTFFAGGRVSPPVPAQLTGKLMIYGVAGIVEHEFSGQADEYGFFILDAADYQFETQGEYVVDYEVRYTDADNALWAASMRGAGVIASESSDFVSHGARGIAAQTGNIYRPAWFSTAQYPPPELAFDGIKRSYYPYHAGDVAVVQDGRDGGLHPIMHIQDTQGTYSDWLITNIPSYVAHGETIAQQAIIDELPLRSVLGGPFGDYGTALLPDFIVNKAYAYISAVRPDITVRQMVLGQDDRSLPIYWDSDDTYNQQIGAGLLGDRPGDYMFLFGGSVVKNGETGINDVSAYAAVAVVVDDETPSGVYPPYGGATGRGYGAALTSDGLDVLFHPTAIRPGQVLTEGSPFVIAGQVAPTLLSQVDVLLTSPDEEVTHFSDLTSAVGYYYNANHKTVLDQIGIWRVEIVVTPLGPSAFGPLEPPVPLGSVPGVRNSSFSIYVVPQDSIALEWNNTVTSAFRPGVLTNISLSVPPEWSQARGHYTVATSSYVLDAGTIQPSGRTMSYQLNPVSLNREFPNFEADGRGEGSASSDVLTLTFAITGLDGEGNPVIRTRIVTIFHDRLRSFNEK